MFQALMSMADESVRQMQRTQTRLLQAATQSPAKNPEQAHSVLVPLKHVSAYHDVLANMATRQLHICLGLLESAFKPTPDASLLVEFLQMQQAVFKRLSTQQTQFLEDLAALSVGAGAIRKANTLSKLMDQEYDFFAQLNALLAGQGTALTELMESIQIGYSYLLTRKAQGEGP